MGRGLQKQIWVLGLVGYNRHQKNDQYAEGKSSILFLLALSILWMGCRAILARSIISLRIRWYRMKKFRHGSVLMFLKFL